MISCHNVIFLLFCLLFNDLCSGLPTVYKILRYKYKSLLTETLNITQWGNTIGEIMLWKYFVPEGVGRLRLCQSFTDGVCTLRFVLLLYIYFTTIFLVVHTQILVALPWRLVSGGGRPKSIVVREIIDGVHKQLLQDCGVTYDSVNEYV